ncbi:50S ribosomal protein L29 [Candidatus Arthromitus sp. SFB-rat-Yit]|uniref:50S ribosomal protein L29 n=1 Tax=Candidatus Arthromitus sp. SFB-rat-Yit TaxID=1041504 RepID=UPI000227A806|nr:50S ribosomal protein L29 [Candidatus Arthromitus sp. SFB-rat-Yit]BAK81779.1 ribosomal protein L29 [Candidatus Arthromitus sp. SFB-rat-Yit]
MKISELKELRLLDISEMNAKLIEFKSELFNLRFQLAVGQLANPMRIREVKKSIAQIKTAIKEHEIMKLK